MYFQLRCLLTSKQRWVAHILTRLVRDVRFPQITFYNWMSYSRNCVTWNGHVFGVMYKWTSHNQPETIRNRIPIRSSWLWKNRSSWTFGANQGHQNSEKTWKTLSGWWFFALLLWKMMEFFPVGMIFHSQVFLESHNPFHGSSDHQPALWDVLTMSPGMGWRSEPITSGQCVGTQEWCKTYQL